MSKKKTGSIARRILVAMSILLTILLIVYVVTWRISAREVLEAYISPENYQYFFGDNEVKHSSDRRDSSSYIVTTVALEKISKLLETRILDDCDNGRLLDTVCSDPIWYKTDRDEYSKRFYDKSWLLEEIMTFKPGEYCTEVMTRSLYESDGFPPHTWQAACVNIETGIFKFNIAP